MTQIVPPSAAAVFLAGMLLAGAPCRAQSTCGPPALGSPCALGGPALLPPNEPALNLGAGNPIHLATGNKYQQETDLPSMAGAPGLEIVRHYNSRNPRSAGFGPGWSLSYDARLHRVGATWQIAQPDGSRVLFQGGPDGPRPSRHGRLESVESGWRWTWPGGRTLQFDAHGWLAVIRLNKQHSLTLVRHDGPGPLRGAVSSITHSGGANLALHYRMQDGQPYVDYIDSPAGRFQYHYEPIPHPGSPDTSAWRLASVTRPDGMRRRYLHEPARQAGNPTLLTGIAIVSADEQQTVRTNTWAYDGTGRAILSTQGEPDTAKGRVAITYVRPPSPGHPGLTRVTNAAGRHSQFTIAARNGRYVLLGADGAGCPGCPAPGTHARYDDQGRLAALNNLRIHRDASGSINALAMSGMGWPALTLHYQADGRRASWESAGTGAEHLRFDAAHRPVRREFANGDVWAYAYDTHGRPTQMRASNTRATRTTTLSWRGRLLERIGHPHENEQREYDTGQHLVRRTVERPDGLAPRRHTDSFAYDAYGRLVRHGLPEGGALLYRYTPEGRLQAVDWVDRSGHNHVVIASTKGQPGYRYGNGLTLVTRRTHGQDSDLVVTDANGIVLAEKRQYDTRGRLAQERHVAPRAGLDEAWRYAYDAQDRMAAAQRFTPAQAKPSSTSASMTLSLSPSQPPAAPGTTVPPIWYAWRDDGSLAARRENGHTQRPVISRDSSGLPRMVDGIQLEYGPGRRLQRATRGNTTLATYRHNALGQRIRATTAHARTDYFYLDNKVVAEATMPATAAQPSDPATTPASGRPAPSRMTRRYVYAGDVLVGLIDYPPGQPDAMGELYAVHADLLGAPRAVTDASRAIRWLAAYTPTGQASRIAGDLTLDVRLPGQMFDAATGWHDNLLRTYVPALGHYLEPDPLGPVPGNQMLGYARQRPRRYTDPLGLLLFAFDGTRNSPATQTNVWKMASQYLDGPVFYQAGPGSPTSLDWDAVTAHSAPGILAAQWDALLQALARPASRNDTIPIDIIGFSRGAALARHFANQIASYVHGGYFSYTDAERGVVTACVDLRFMGLFDTVAQFGLLGAQDANYDLSIASAWEWVAHAVALQERRRLFPLVSVAGQGGNTIEAPFIGAHADIGGGVSVDDAGHATAHGDLSDVALNWMLWQARAAAARFAPPAEEDREITDPVLHDQRLASTRSTVDGDRRVDGPGGNLLVEYQDDHLRLGHAPRTATEAFITRVDNWRYLDTAEVGTVDMDGYARWLHDELGWQTLPA